MRWTIIWAKQGSWVVATCELLPPAPPFFEQGRDGADDIVGDAVAARGAS